MNYNILVCGKLNKSFDTVIKLIIESAKESDYLVSHYAYPVLSPFSSLCLDIKLVGSAKKSPLELVLDFDNVYSAAQIPLILSPKTIWTELTDNNRHYWGVAGSLFKLIGDLSPAFITSYLLEQKMNDELALFKQYISVALPQSFNGVGEPVAF